MSLLITYQSIMFGFLFFLFILASTLGPYSTLKMTEID